MKYAFFGTPRFAATVLQILIEGDLPPTLVICNPDRPVGRNQIMTAPPTKILAEKHGIDVVQPETLRTENPEKSLRDLGAGREIGIRDMDFAVVAAYTHIIPQSILDLPRLGTIGVHPSLLPQFRGPTPIQSAILEDAHETGVTLYLMDSKVDHGPMLATSHLPLAISETYEALEKKLGELGGKLLLETLPRFMNGQIVPQSQDHDAATFTKKFITADGEVNFAHDAPEIMHRKIRALNPEPGVFTLSYPGMEGVRVKLLAAHLENGKLAITKIQKAGGKPIDINN